MLPGHLSNHLTLLSARMNGYKWVLKKTCMDFFMIFKRQRFLFLSKLSKNFEIMPDLKKICCKLGISPRKGQNSITKLTYPTTKLLQYLCP